MDELLGAMAERGDTNASAEHLKINYSILIEKVLKDDKYCLHRAIDSKLLELLKVFLEAGALPDQRSEQCYLPMARIAQLDDFELAINMAQLLINAGSNVSELDIDCYKHVVKKNNIELLRLLLSSGSIRKITRYFALREAVEQQNVQMAKMLLDALAPRPSPSYVGQLFVSPIFNNVEMVQLLIDYGAATDEEDPETMTMPLNEAASIGNLEVVKILLDAGANVNYVCYDDSWEGDNDVPGSALHDAVKAGHVEVVKLLLEYKADVNALNQYGTSVLYNAAARCYTRGIDDDRYIEILRILLSHGADMHCRGECQNFYLPFKVAIETGNMDAIRLFIEFGANFDDVCLDDEQEDTVLHLAAQNEDSSVLEFALSRRPNDIHKCNVNGDSPLGLAVCCMNPANIELLIKHGADVNYPKADTPLHSAVYLCRVDHAELLLNNGAHINYKTETNEDVSILAFALRSNARDEKIYEVIVKHIALLEMKGAHVDPINYPLIRSRDDVWRYFESCKAELLQMRDSVVDGHITFYRILEEEDISGYARNQQVVDYFENQRVEEVFPHYGSKILKKMNLARERVKMLNDVVLGMSSVLDFDPSSHHVIYSSILKYVPEDDWPKLKKLRSDDFL